MIGSEWSLSQGFYAISPFFLPGIEVQCSKHTTWIARDILAGTSESVTVSILPWAVSPGTLRGFPSPRAHRC